MNEEFPQLKEVDYQKRFLSDWWSERKAFTSARRQGKSTLMMCEGRRFQRAGFNVLVLTSTQHTSEIFKKSYRDVFGEMPTFEVGSLGRLAQGEFRGYKYDVVIVDEMQDVEKAIFSREILPMDPMFIRASFSESQYRATAWNKLNFFDSVYRR